MKLSRFEDARYPDEILRWGLLFNFEEDAQEVFSLFPKSLSPERIERLIVMDRGRDYELADALYGQMKNRCRTGYYYCILFASPEQAQQAREAIGWQLDAYELASCDNHLAFSDDLNRVTMHRAIAQSGIPDEDWCFLQDAQYIPIPFKESKFNSNPKILVRDLDAYEATGERREIWIDAFHEEDVLMGMISWWVAQSPATDAAEWEIVKTDDFFADFERIVDYTDIAKVSYFGRAITQHGDAFMAYYHNFYGDSKMPRFEDERVRFCGCYGDIENFFLEQLKDSGHDGGEMSGECFQDFCQMVQENYTIAQYEGNYYVYDIC